MALDYVRAGETVKASTVNSLVDAALGTQTPSPDLVYTTTPHGTQMSLPSKYGKPNGPLVHYLDTEMCVLSGWQFVKLALGHELDDCLEVFKLHTADGEVANPVSAAVVYKNSPESPTTDVLSGYLLSDECFGLDRAAGSSGWVQTLIEYTNGQVPAKAELWSWRKPEEMAAVFTNVEDQLSVKNMLSVLLDNGGVDGDQLSSLERIGSWPLTYSTSLSVMRDGHVKWVPTHQLVRVHDDIDIWDSEEVKTHHVNTASLVCYNLETHEDQQTGKTVIDNAKFAWKYWLGPDSSFEDGESIKFAYSHSWTINGQPAVFKVEEEIDELTAYDGSDVAIQDERGGYSILHGEFELNPEDGEEDEQGNIDAGSLFVNFNYYEEYAAMIGELGSQNNSTVSELSKSCFLAKQKEECRFAEGDEISIGMELPRRYFIFGTWSAVDKDRPLADEECPEYEDGEKKEKKSLQWKDNKPDDDHSEPVDETGVKSLQLYRFSEVVKSECDRLSDLSLSDQAVFVARRVDEDGGAFIDYINIDDLSTLVDSKCETLYLSSIQELAYTFTDDQGDSHSIPYHQLYGFNQSDIQLDYNKIDKYDVVLRDSDTPAQGAQVSYIPLGDLSAKTDTQLTEMSSVQWNKRRDGMPYLQFFDFTEPNIQLDTGHVNDFDLVVRDRYTPAQGQQVSYIPLSSLSTMTDTDMSDMSSIQWDHNARGPFIQLYRFNNDDRQELAWEDFGRYDLVLRDNQDGVVEYSNLSSVGKTTVSCALYSVDSQFPAIELSSIQVSSWTDEDGEEHLYNQLYNFQNPATEVPIFDVGCYEVVVRDYKTSPGGGIVNYTPLSSLQISASNVIVSSDSGSEETINLIQVLSGLSGEVDSILPPIELSSIQVSSWTDPQDGKVHTYHQLFNFQNPSTQIPIFDTGSYEVVVRDYKTSPGGGIVSYTPLSDLQISASNVIVSSNNSYQTINLIQALSGISSEVDAMYPQLQLSSIQNDEFVNPKTGLKYHQLFNFQNEPIDITQEDWPNFEIIVRDRKTAPGGQIVNYARLSSVLSGGYLSCDTEKVVSRKSIDTVLSGQCAPYYQLHDFHTSAGTGPQTYVKFSDQPLSGQDFSIGCQTQFVVRQPDGMGGYEIRYQTLSIDQEHERVDSWTANSDGWSIDYATYVGEVGCYNVLELYNFRYGCTTFITSADISSNSGNGILIRKWNDYGCCWSLEYMDFNSLDELAIKYIGDSQLSLSAHNPYQRSAEVYYDQADQKKYVQLYGFDTDIDNASVTIHNDGCTYYWPQDSRTDQQQYEWDYILVKHIDSNGNITLQYKQLEVTMPDIDVTGIQGDIQNIYGDIYNFYDEINYLSVCIDDLSGHLSGDFWESGGDASTCYGSEIGNSNGTVVIDLDNCELEGCFWYAPNFEATGVIQADGGFYAANGSGYYFTGGCSYISNSYAYIDGTVNVGCYLNIGCTWFQSGGGGYIDGGLEINGCVTVHNGDFNLNGDFYGCGLIHGNDIEVYQGGTFKIGNTTMNEAQLSALLQLVNAPQMLQNL